MGLCFLQLNAEAITKLCKFKMLNAMHKKPSRTTSIFTSEQTCNFLTIWDMKLIIGPTMQRSCQWGVLVIKELRIGAFYWVACWHSVLHGDWIIHKARWAATCWYNVRHKRERGILLLRDTLMVWYCPIKLVRGLFPDRTLTRVHIAQACKGSLILHINWFGWTQFLQ